MPATFWSSATSWLAHSHILAKRGAGEYLPLAGDLLSFNDIVGTLNSEGHNYTFNRVPANVFATFFPGAAELAEMFSYFEEHTYFGMDRTDQIALANKVAGRRPTDFAAWARLAMPVKSMELESVG